MLLFLYICLCICAARVSANALAGPYQTLWEWYAYRIDGMRDQPAMALDCSGTDKNGRCFFDEFLEHIQDAKPHQKWLGQTSVGTNLDPDVDQTAQELRTQGVAGDPTTRYSNKLKLSRLFTSFTGGQTTFSQPHQMIMDVVQKARKELGDEHLAGPLEAARKAWAGIHGMRVVDHQQHMLDAFKDEIAKQLTIPRESIPTMTTTMAGQQVELVDSAALLAQNPNLKEKKIHFVRNFVPKYNAGEAGPGGLRGKGPGKGHMAAIEAAQSFASKINNPPDEC